MHATIRATLLPEIVRLIQQKTGWSEEKALDQFYCSATGASFSDDETGLYGQSALYIYGLFMDEIWENSSAAGSRMLKSRGGQAYV